MVVQERVGPVQVVSRCLDELSALEWVGSCLMDKPVVDH